MMINSIISEAKAMMVVLLVSNVMRNLVQIFVDDGTIASNDRIDIVAFYIQTLVFLASIVISFIYPVIIRNQLIIPLPSVPERIEVLRTAIHGELIFNKSRSTRLFDILPVVGGSPSQALEVPELICPYQIL